MHSDHYFAWLFQSDNTNDLGVRLYEENDNIRFISEDMSVYKINSSVLFLLTKKLKHTHF
jgi:hypothetical protein